MNKDMTTPAKSMRASAAARSAIVKRSVELHGHKTSVSLEDEFWEGLREIAAIEKTPLPILLRNIDGKRGSANLSSAIRVYVLEFFRDAAPGKRQCEQRTPHAYR